ncbi:DUF4231 domain-containing protein [Embleya sp. NBC_00896]|uniref:DUF4231 domain-containing protein n=1 Tax=Embleya sp. NBC_00896 TaxID=2975961 RepID=UPI0038691E5B|nr:DUF4231 domain-containing protein [Embleya sp. NBC_00896]
MTVGTDPTLELTWHAQRRWSLAASAAKTSVQRWRLARLVLGVIGAVAATAGTQVGGDPGKALSLVGALCVGLVPLITSLRLPPARIEAWTRLRSVSEALKSEVYLYLTVSAPYAGGTAERRAELSARSRRYEEEAGELAALLPQLDPSATPAPPAVHDVDSYVRERIDRQADGYYRDQVLRMRRGVARIRFAEFVLAVTGMALAIVAGTSDTQRLGAWVPVVTTVSVSVMLYGYGVRYQENLISFARTAEQLRRLRDDRSARMPLDPAEEARFVERCENVVSIETQGWMARAALADPGPPQ